jgi:hypothetical protein
MPGDSSDAVANGQNRRNLRLVDCQVWRHRATELCVLLKEVHFRGCRCGRLPDPLCNDSLINDELKSARTI